jgi:DASS family divalent anion:Na+ symporter
MTIEDSLKGYADPSVWLVLAAFFIARALLKTGLARRIALLFVRGFGGSSLGVAYALSLSDVVLAPAIPSNGARSGGVVLPILRSISELYGSHPGATAGLLGTFLTTAVYQNICVSSAMFFTGQASNPLAAGIAQKEFHYTITFASWFLAGLAPGIVSLAVVPLIVHKLSPPVIKKTPEASAFARREMQAMGPMRWQEWVTFGVFVSVCLLWITAKYNHLEVGVTALLGSSFLLLVGVIDWEDVKNERTAWDIFVWYGGLLRLGKALGEVGVTTAFAQRVGSSFGVAGWVTVFAGALFVYFYAHYGFASITAHLLAMFSPFGVVLIAKGAPVGLVMYSFAMFANLSAGLTHYGTTPSPMFFATEYVPFKKWWGIGFLISVVNLTIWSTIGFAWWKILKIW